MELVKDNVSWGTTDATANAIGHFMREFDPSVIWPSNDGTQDLVLEIGKSYKVDVSFTANGAEVASKTIDVELVDPTEEGKSCAAKIEAAAAGSNTTANDNSTSGSVHFGATASFAVLLASMLWMGSS